MKKTLLLVMLVITTYGLYGQKLEKIGIHLSKDLTQNAKKGNNCGTVTPGDLVINGDFEQFSGLPTSVSQLRLACNWMDDANLATPDYLHRNSPAPNMSIPSNIWGNQDVNPIHGGDAYAGMWISNSNGTIYTEIIKTQLDAALQPNTEYTLTFDVSLSDNYAINPVMFQAYLGMNFNTNNNDELPILSDPSAILLNNTSFSTNTTGWDTITFTFTTGNVAGQEYLYIGGISNTVYQDPTGSGGFGSYYYVDNVSLVEVDSCPDCDLELSTQIQEDLWLSFQEDEKECGLYSFRIPELEDCFEIMINWGDGQTDFVTSNDSGTVLTHQYTSDATFTICTQLFVDGERCGRSFCRRVTVDCEECPECDPERSAQILDNLWSNFEEDEKECGLYSFRIPELVECYEIMINWGDGQTDIVSTNDSGTVLSHQYDANGSFTICAQVLIDGKDCGDKVCKKINIDCFDPNPECDWLKSIGTVNGSSEEEIGVSVVVDSNDDVIMLGASLANTNIEGTVIAGTTFLSKYDPSGCFISATDITFVGVPVDMEINNNDEFLILSKDNIGYNGANNRYYLSKLSSTGNLIWTVTLSYSQAVNNGVDTVKMDLKKATNEVFLLTTVRSVLDITHTGGTTTLQQILGSNDTKASIIKINPNGSIGWSQTAYGLGSVNGISISASENTNEVFFLGRGRSEGAGSSQYYDVIFRNNNTGVENTAAMIPNNYNFNVLHTDFIAKITATNGTFITFSCFPDWRSSPATKLEYNHNTSQLFTLYLPIMPQTGHFIATVGNNLAPINQFQYFSNSIYSAVVNGNFLYISGISSSSRFHISKINSAGVVWGKTPSNSFSLAKDVAFNGDKIYTTGYFRNGNINLGNGTQIDHIGDYDAFLTRLTDQGGTSIFSKIADDNDDVMNKQKDESNDLGLTLYPNPASDVITLRFSKTDVKKYQVSIRNTNGSVVLKVKNQETVNVKPLSTGIYFIEVITEKGSHYVKKLIIN